MSKAKPFAIQTTGQEEPYESRGSRTVLRGAGGAVPSVYSIQILRPQKKLEEVFSK